MTAAELLVELDCQGFTLVPEGAGIRVTPASRLTADLREQIRRRKDTLLALLYPGETGPALTGAVSSPAELPAEWHELWNERAAIMEYDGGLPRERAEAKALTHILWQIRGTLPAQRQRIDPAH